MALPIRPGMLRDVEHMARIVREAFDDSWTQQMLQATVLNRLYEVRVIRRAGGSLIGFFVAHVMLSESNLDILAVDAPQRGRGYGSRLLNAWIRSARDRNLTGLTLQVNIKNERAIDLYRAMRFEQTRLLSDYYPNGDSAWEMRRSIDVPNAGAPLSSDAGR